MEAEEADPWPGWNPYEAHAPVLDMQDCVKDAHALRARLEQDGIVVVSGVVDDSECASLVRHMHTWLERRGVDAEDTSTWSEYSNENFQMSPTIPGMMNTTDAAHSIAAIKARSNPSMVRLFSMLHGVHPEDLVMDMGGVFWTFAPEHYPDGQNPGEPRGGYYHWDQMWMHTDRGRKLEEKPKLQATMLVEGVGMQDYGLVYLSDSHRFHDEYMRTHTVRFKNESRRRGRRDAYIQFTYDEVEYLTDRGCRWMKVVAPKGSVVVWENRLVHSTMQPVRGRPEPKPRFVVYGGLKPAREVDEKERGRRVRRLRGCEGEDLKDLLTLMDPRQREGRRILKLVSITEQVVMKMLLAVSLTQGGVDRGRKRRLVDPVHDEEYTDDAEPDELAGIYESRLEELRDEGCLPLDVGSQAEIRRADDADDAAYCVCRKSYNGVHDPMVQCTLCKEWYHCRCVNLMHCPPEEVEGAFELFWYCNRPCEPAVGSRLYRWEDFDVVVREVSST